jgi:hypothetical protein
MKRFIEGEDLNQSTLFPECLEDYLAEDNPVRVIDVFVDELDLSQLGFEQQHTVVVVRRITAVWFAGVFAWHGDPINYTELYKRLRIYCIAVCKRGGPGHRVRHRAGTNEWCSCQLARRSPVAAVVQAATGQWVHCVCSNL